MKYKVKYLTKLLISYPMAFLFGIFSYRKGFDKMITWLNNDR